jgi:hypothetical protein
MPVTELALLRLRPGTSLSDHSFRSKLAEAKRVMETYSNNLATTVHHPTANPTHINTEDIPKPAPDQHQFFYYSQHEDPSHLYIIGSWPSAAMHRQSFIPSAENQELLSKFKDDISVESMFHVEIEQSSVPLDAPVLAIGQHWITPSNNAGFEEAFEDNRHHLEHFSTRKLAGGWRHEKEERPDGGQKDVFVLFSGWDDVDHHMKFGKSQSYEEYSKIIKWIDEGGFEVKHAVKVDL